MAASWILWPRKSSVLALYKTPTPSLVPTRAMLCEHEQITAPGPTIVYMRGPRGGPGPPPYQQPQTYTQPKLLTWLALK